ncbi:MAG: methylenetetrahydrofolate reductase C-terminal domain-containing protein [Chloroflexota bacterium]
MATWRYNLAIWLETAFGGSLYKAIVWAERTVKGPVFGCQMCGQCALRYTGFVCPMSCPKQLRNGPCGGSENGRCEVYPDRPCVWVLAHQRMSLLHRQEQMERILPEIDWSLVGTSAWLNHLAGRDARMFAAQPQLPAPKPGTVALAKAPVSEDRKAA